MSNYPKYFVNPQNEHYFKVINSRMILQINNYGQNYVPSLFVNKQAKEKLNELKANKRFLPVEKEVFEAIAEKFYAEQREVVDSLTKRLKLLKK